MNLYKTIVSLATLIFLFAGISNSQVKQQSFKPGELWPDNHGVHINAHGGGILKYEGTYYWFGEHKTEGEAGNRANVGVHCYSSKDLYNWKDEGIALAVSQDPESEIVKGCVIERPKVIFNQKTKKFVMWFHLELKSMGYKAARTGLAVADSPTGPFRYIKSLNPNAGQWPVNFTKEQKEMQFPANLKSWSVEWKNAVANGMFVHRDFEKGHMARDMTLFVDEDGKAYHIHASEENLTLHISELNDDYTGFTNNYATVVPAGHNEAPAIFKKDGKYFLITSGCTGWAPNAARSFVADHVLGPWIELGNPCRGTEEEMKTTFESQSTFILENPYKTGQYIFMADRWRPKNAIDGRYIWLPILFEDGKPALKWMDKWDLSKMDSVISLNNVKESYKLSGKNLVALAEKILYKKTPQEDMFLYILRPLVKTKKALPAIVYFTGGGWVNGNVAGQIPNPAWFRDQGIIGIEADYRVKSRHGTTPIECIQDAKSAIRFVRANAKKLGIDPNRIIAAGGSAGGHLAACTFLDGGDAPGENLKISSKPNGLVLHNPVLGEGFGKDFFDAHPEFSPIKKVKKGWPPTILSNGTIDKTTPYLAAEKFMRLMNEAGNVCELITVKDAGHSCDWPVNNPNFLPTIHRMTEFLREQKLIK